MNIGYIREIDYSRITSLIEKLIYKLKKCFNLIGLEEKDDKVIFKVPKTKRINKKKKIINKICKKLEEKNINIIALDNVFNTDELVKNILYSKGMKILDGRWIFNFLIIETLEYIARVSKIELEKQEVGILVNNNNEINLENIIKVAKTVKRVNIITNNISKFKYVERKLYEDFRNYDNNFK